jgi:hypothetical protein
MTLNESAVPPDPGGVTIGGNTPAIIYQRFVPDRSGVTNDDIIDAVIATAKNAGWEFQPDPFTGQLCGDATPLPDGSVTILTIAEVPTDAPDDEAVVSVTIVPGRSACDAGPRAPLAGGDSPMPEQRASKGGKM